MGTNGFTVLAEMLFYYYIRTRIGYRLRLKASKVSQFFSEFIKTPYLLLVSIDFFKTSKYLGRSVKSGPQTICCAGVSRKKRKRLEFKTP